MAGVGSAAQAVLCVPEWWNLPVDPILPPSVELFALTCLNDTDLKAKVKDHRKFIKDTKNTKAEGHQWINCLAGTNQKNLHCVQKMEGAINVLNDRMETNITNMKQHGENIKMSHILINKSEVVAITSQKLLDGALTTFQYKDHAKVHHLTGLDTDEKWENIKIPALSHKLNGCNRLKLYKNLLIPFNNGKEIHETPGKIKVFKQGEKRKWRWESEKEFKAYAQGALGYVPWSTASPPALPPARLQPALPAPMITGTINPFMVPNIISGFNEEQLAAVKHHLENPFETKLSPSIASIFGTVEVLSFLYGNRSLLDGGANVGDTAGKGPAHKKQKKG